MQVVSKPTRATVPLQPFLSGQIARFGCYHLGSCASWEIQNGGKLEDGQPETTHRTLCCGTLKPLGVQFGNQIWVYIVTLNESFHEVGGHFSKK